MHLLQLHNLLTLDLGLNRIGDVGAESLNKLKHLKWLNLAGNKIGDRGAKALAALSRLTYLNLFENQIAEAGAMAILDAWADPTTSATRESLQLGSNPGSYTRLPGEILEQSDAQAIIAAWRSFKAAEAAGTLRPLNEAKMLVVGKGNVGKTSLVNYLMNGTSRDPKEPATEGMRAWEKIETRTWTPDGSPVALNIWDFGGQEIYHGTLRYFLTARSLYLLVLDDRNDSERDARDWLRRIENHASTAPVIVVVNKCDDSRSLLRLDEPGLRQTFPQIIAFVRTSCDPGSDDMIASLRQAIVATLADPEILTDVHIRRPPEWLAVKDRLALAARSDGVVSEYDYRRLCEESGIEEPNLQRGLLAILHNLGTVVAHGLDQDARAVRRETTLLDPNWLTQAIYTILGSTLVRDRHGEFAPEDLRHLLDPKLYPPERHEYVVDLMQDAELGLCLKLANDPERYLLPAALPPSIPTFAAGAYSVLRRYRYTTLPADLMPRFMVQAKDEIARGSARWRDGVILDVAGCSALVRAFPDPLDRRIEVAVDARAPNTRPGTAIERIDSHLAAVHKRYSEIEPEACVPLPDQPDIDVSLNFLRQLEAQHGLDYRHHPKGSDRDYAVRELLEGVREKRAAAAITAPSPTWFKRLASWQGNAVVGGLIGALAIFLLVPFESLSPRLGASLLAGWVFFFSMRRLDPDLGLMRLMLPLGLAGVPLFLGVGYSLQIVLSADDNPSWLNLQTASGVVSVIGWAWVMTVLIIGWVADRRNARQNI